MIPPNYFCIINAIAGGAFQVNSIRNDYFITVNRSLGEYASDPPENINVNQLEYHPGDRENKIPPYWTNEYFQNRVWVDDDTKFAIEQTDRLTFAIINRDYRPTTAAQKFNIRVSTQPLGSITSIWQVIFGIMFLTCFAMYIIDFAHREAFQDERRSANTGYRG